MRYDAVQFLESLFQPSPAADPPELSAEWHVEWDERAAIMEYDGGLAREVAEHYALLEVQRLMTQSGYSGSNPEGE